MKKIRIVHMLCSNSFSGAENVVCQIVNAFKNDENVEFVYTSPDGPIRDALKDRDIDFEPMAAATIGEFKRVIHKVKPDIVHAHDMRAGFYAALACGNIPLVSHIHNNNFDSQGLSLKSVMYYFAGLKATHIFWVSKSAYDGYAFHKKFEKKSGILYNVIDSSAVYKKAAEDAKEYAYDIVYVGRLTHQKNPQRLVKVLAGVAQKCPEMKAAIIGAGDLEDETRQAIAEHHSEQFIDMLGYSSNPYKAMKQAKILIMTSRWEGLPMCALEAMALGVPIVSTPTDGLKEIVEDDKTGYLSDDDSVLVDRCCAILSEPERYRRLSTETLKKATGLLDIKSYRERISKVYDHCLQ